MFMRNSGSSSITFKAILIGGIVLLLLVPLMMLRGLVEERAQLREEAYSRVAEGWGGDSVVGGPVIVIPTERTVLENDKRRTQRIDLYLLPSQLNAKIDMKMQAEPRYVGIYAVPVYLTSLQLTGAFDLTSLKPYLNQPEVTYLWDQARVRLPLSQSRSLREVVVARVANVELKLAPAARSLLRGVEASVAIDPSVSTSGVDFKFDLVIAGSRGLAFLPVGSETSVTMHSNWPHPAFQGSFLPVEHSISNTEFDARWQVLELNRPYRQVWLETEVDEATLMESTIGIGLYQSIDVYQRAERAIKYALLFIALTFLTFFAWEQLSGLRLHPLQYLLVGLALSMFYVLLIALSEHIAFLYAYTTAATALVSLMGIYISGALRSTRRGIIVAAAMSLIYGLLYALILSEDYALLMGAITLFAALATVMIATRRIDWYRLNTEPSN